jgi:hypothetical protein
VQGISDAGRTDRTSHFHCCITHESVRPGEARRGATVPTGSRHPPAGGAQPRAWRESRTRAAAGQPDELTIAHMTSDLHQRAWQAAARLLRQREAELRETTAQWKHGVASFQALIDLKDEVQALWQLERDLFHKTFQSPPRAPGQHPSHSSNP